MRLFIWSIALGCYVLSAHAQGFREFRIPTNRSSGVSFSASTNLSRNDFGRDSQGNQNDYISAQATVYGYYHFDSENLSWKIVPYISMWGTNSTYDYHSIYAERVSDSESSVSDATQSANLSASSIYYPSARPLGLEAAISTYLSHRESWRHAEDFSVDTSISRTWSYLSDFKNDETYRDFTLELGIGWGRIRNATGVYSTHYLEEWLNELRLLDGELSEETRRKLAELAYQQGNYIREHQRPAKFYWSDVEEILSEDPSFKGPLNAYAVHRLAEASIGIKYKPIGFRFGVYPRFLHYYDSNERKDENFRVDTWGDESMYDTMRFDRSSSRQFTNELIVGPRIQYFRPIGYRWQLNAESGIDRRVCSPDAGFALNNYFTAIYSIFDKLSLSYGMEHVRWLDATMSRDETRGSWWGVRSWIGASYFIEDQVQLSLTLQHIQTREEEYTPNLMDYYDAVNFNRTTNVYFSCTYRLGGDGSQASGILPRPGIERVIFDYPSTYQSSGPLDF